jgi:hypothetical protein
LIDQAGKAAASERTSNVEGGYDIPNAGDARKTVTRADKLRGNFLSFFTENENHDDPLNYDLTINMKQVSMDKAVDLILGMLS